MSDAEDRVQDFLDFWAVYAAEFQDTFAEECVCDPPCGGEYERDDRDVICAEYHPASHVLRASDIRFVLADLHAWRTLALSVQRRLSELEEHHRTADVWEG